jgi:S1-C subfamily serine protease
MIDQDPEPPRHGLPPSRRQRTGQRLRSAGARARRAAPFAGGILAAFIAVALYGAFFPGPRPLTQRDVNVSVASALASQTPPPAFSQLVYQEIQPALVLIETDSTTTKGVAEHGLGTGVVVDASGAILTALHVVDGASTIHLTFADGTKSSATVTVTRPETDIAVLQPDSPPSGLAPATLGNPNAIRVGSEAYIVGNPYGLYSSISAGVVSGLGRSFQVPNSDQVIHGLIQVDAAVNPGNSGGPLLNRSGEVVGIVTGLVNPTKEDVFIGIGLAVPIDVAGSAAGLPQY